MTPYHFYSIGILLVAFTLASPASGQVRPPNFSPDAIPETSFTCEDKITGGYYADQEAECQLFHVCVQVSEYEFQDFRFLCPNDTVFDQQNLVCTNWFEVDCRQSVSFFFQGVGLRTVAKTNNNNNQKPAAPQEPRQEEEEEYEYEYTYSDYDDQNRFLANSTPSPASGNDGVGGGIRGQGFQNSNNIDQDFNDDERVRPKRPPKTTTAIPISVTTTRRPPRVKSNLAANKRPTKRPTIRPEVPVEFTQPDITDDRSKDPFKNPPLISADGKKPRVKSNLNTGSVNGGFAATHEKTGVKSSQKVNFDEDAFKFVPPQEELVVDYEVELNGGFDQSFTLSNGPEVRPDGRPPRIKANIEAIRHNQGRKIVQSPVSTESPFDAILPNAKPFTQTPLPPAPIVEPSREKIQDVPNNFFVTERTQNSGPRVKSNILAGKANTGQRNRVVIPQDQLPGALSRLPTTPQPAVVTTTQSPTFFHSSTLLSIFDDSEQSEFNEPEFIDEIDEFELPAVTTTSRPFIPPSPTRRQRPRVKSNILVARKNKFQSQQGQPEKTRSRVQFNNVKFVSNVNENEVDDDGIADEVDDGNRCSNPFKCPPSKPADGRKPRVKSNIKARNRNYFHPSTSHTNRIRGKPSFKNTQQQTRNGKASRKPFEKVRNNELPKSSSLENDGLNNNSEKQEDEKRDFFTGTAFSQQPIVFTTERQFAAHQGIFENAIQQQQLEQQQVVSSTTESLLMSLLNQIEEDKKNNVEPLIFTRPDHIPQIPQAPQIPQIRRRPQKPVQRPQRPVRPISPTPSPQTSPPPPAIHFTTSTTPFSIVSTTDFISTTQRPGILQQQSSSPPRTPKQQNQLGLNGAAISTTVKPEYEYYYEYEYEDDDYQGGLEPPSPIAPEPSPLTTQNLPVSTTEAFLQADLASPQPLVTPQVQQSPVTLPPRPTVSDPGFPPIPTFSPEQLRKQRIQSFRLARPPKGFPAFTKKKVAGNKHDKEEEEESSTQSTRFPLKSRPTPFEPRPETTPEIQADNAVPFPSTDARKPRVKSDLKQARINSGVPASREARKFQPSRFNQKLFKNLQKEPDSEELIVTTESSSGLNEITQPPLDVEEDETEIPSISVTTENVPVTTRRLSVKDLFGDPAVKPDGRRPRVKSNIKQRLADNGRNFLESQKIPVPADLFEPKNHEERSIDQSKAPQNLLDETAPIVSVTEPPVSGKSAESANHEENEVLSQPAGKGKSNLLLQLKNGKFKIDPNEINQSSDHEPLVRPDGLKPRVKSNILANQRDHHQTPNNDKKNYAFRHSKKVEDSDFVFEPTTLRNLEEPVETSTPEVLTTTTEHPSTATEEPATTTTEFPVSSTHPTSLLDALLSTQVLNTRAVDPTLASLHEKIKEEFEQQQKYRRRKRKSKKKDLGGEENDEEVEDDSTPV